MLPRFKALFTIKFIFLLVHGIWKVTGALAADYEIQKWRVIEIELRSAQTYADPFAGVDVTATFTGPGDQKITRPAFWDGGRDWKIRFAPNETGVWTMTTHATDSGDTGLHQISKTVACVPYTGECAIYKNGFLKNSSTGRYLIYADGTPFFYLGDTHWILPHERFATSNAPDVASQFKYTVDKRVQQGFTVFQSEPIWQPHGGNHAGTDEEIFANLTDGFSEADLAGFANLDRKFKYIAEQGLVHANAQVDWATNPANHSIFTETYMARLARYWVARYGAYPVIWTVAQEIDKNMYAAFTAETIKKWFAVGQSLLDHDDYGHPIMPHMENTHSTTWANSWWADKPWHTGWAVQWQGDLTDASIAKGFWNATPTKPLILYEGQYDQFWTDSRGALGLAYKAFQYGIFGYGYGANGVWNDIYSKPGDPPDYGTGYEMPTRYFWWFDGANLATGDQLTHFKNFYTRLEWWKLTPRFDDRTWGAFFNPSRSLLATDQQNTFVVFFFSESKFNGTLKNLEAGARYIAHWFNPRDGQYTFIDSLELASPTWPIPQRPTSEDWVLLVKKTGLPSAGATHSPGKWVPEKFELRQNSPNPFNAETRIGYQLPNPSRARLEIFNITGKRIKLLVNTHQNAGDYSADWNGCDEFNNSVASGVYFYTLKTADFIQSRKLVLVR
jgi:hypothetical protein